MTDQSYRSFLKRLEDQGDLIRFTTEVDPLTNMATLSGPFLHPKVAVAVDEDIDAGDLRQVMWSIANRVRADRDVIMIPNTRVFALDSVSPIVPGQSSYHRIGTKWMIDATMPVASQEEDRKEFEPATPKNFDSVNLADFLP